MSEPVSDRITPLDRISQHPQHQRHVPQLLTSDRFEEVLKQLLVCSTAVLTAANSLESVLKLMEVDSEALSLSEQMLNAAADRSADNLRKIDALVASLRSR